ncbi:MAG: four helix bundle protein [Gemmatimonadaceae bacterium]|nr:four helix bundle protein [Gemmatimonadaceae bacterium]MCW5825379.1 four helix bundle protein [Gemmatimonadaceae bacterium]
MPKQSSFHTDLPPSQEAWELACPEALRQDLLWKLHVYRAALFILHCAKEDARALRARYRGGIADQLERAVGSVSANLAEGYSRAGSADRIRFFSYALGSAREAITWYIAAADVIPEAHHTHRQSLLSKVRAMLLRLIESQRRTTNRDFKRI